MNKLLHVKEDSSIKSSCSVLSSADNVGFMCAYLTRNVSAMEEHVNSLVNLSTCTSPCCCDLIEGVCAYCDNTLPGKCVQFSSNVTNIIVNKSEDHHNYCSPLQIIKFNSISALQSDNGRFIVCAYQPDAFDLKFYSTIQLRVQRNYVYIFEVLFPVLGVIVLVIVVTLICVCVRVRRKRSHNDTLSSKLVSVAVS